MKKLVILTLLLAAGLTAYPQSSSRSRESKSRSSSSVSRSSKSGSSAKKATNSSSNRSKAVRSSSSRSSSNRSSATQAKRSTSSRQSAVRSASSAVKSGNSQSSRSQAVRSSSRRSGSNSASRSYGNSSSSRSSRSNAATRVKSDNSSSRNQGRAQSSSSAVRSRSSSSGDSFNRSNRQGNKIYERSDGSKYRHQNDEVFAHRKYKVDFRSADELRRSNDFRRVYRDYERWNSHRYRRNVIHHYHYRRPLSIEIRRVRYPYRRPVHVDLCWTPWLHYRFMYYYPMHSRWNIDYGSYIETISSYDAMNYAGSVKRVYGRVEEVYYSDQDDTYTLYFGAEFPYHDFSVVVPRNVAKDIAWSPSWYFENEYVWVVGLIDVWEGKPEIVVHDKDQLRRY